MPVPVITYAMESAPQFPGTHISGITPGAAPSAPDMQAVDIIAILEKAVGNLPALPDVRESDEIVVFLESIPNDLAKDDAWEYLNPILNCFLGFNRTEESIYKELQGGAMGLLATVH